MGLSVLMKITFNEKDAKTVKQLVWGDDRHLRYSEFNFNRILPLPDEVDEIAERHKYGVKYCGIRCEEERLWREENWGTPFNAEFGCEWDGNCVEIILPGNSYPDILFKKLSDMLGIEFNVIYEITDEWFLGIDENNAKTVSYSPSCVSK